MVGLIQGCHHTSFTVRDLERSLWFYRDVLGMQVEYYTAERSTPYLAQITGYPGVRMGTALLRPAPDWPHLIELIQYLEPLGVPLDVRTCNPGSAHLCLLTSDIHALYQAMRTAGVACRSEPVPMPSGPNAGGYSVYAQDPDGITIELFQPPR